MKPHKDVANYFGIGIILIGILHWLIPIKQLIVAPWTYIGIVLFVLGWIPNILGGIYDRKIRDSLYCYEKPKKLITTGLFKITRNPTYLGMMVALFGEAIFFGSLVSFIIPVIFAIAIDRVNVVLEEKILEKKFGKKYLDYKKNVRRWV